MDSLPISVVIPAFNRPAMTARAVASALAQYPHPPAEVLVVDDSSSDGTGKAAEAAGARVIRHDANRGEGAARNTGIANASGEWVALLDSDDVWLPHHLASLSALQEEGYVLLGTSALACGDSATDDAVWGVGKTVREVTTPSDLLVYLNYVVASAAMFRREQALTAGGFDEDPKLCADLEFWLRLLECGRGRVSPDVSVLYTLHSGQVSTDRTEMRAALREVMSQFVNRPWLRNIDIERAEGSMLWDELRYALGTRDTSNLVSAGGRLLQGTQRVRGAIQLVWWRRRLARSQRGVSRAGSSKVADLAVSST